MSSICLRVTVEGIFPEDCDEETLEQFPRVYLEQFVKAFHLSASLTSSGAHVTSGSCAVEHEGKKASCEGYSLGRQANQG